MELLFFGLLLAAVPFVLPIVSWVAARRTRALVEEFATTLEQQAIAIDVLKAQVADLRRQVREAAAPAQAPQAAPKTPDTAVSVAKPEPAVPPKPIVSAPKPVISERPAATERPSEPGPSVAAERPRPSVPPPSPAPPRPTAVPPPAVPPPIVPKPPVAPPPPPEEPPPSFLSGFDWESLVGVKLFPIAAGIALVLAAIFFLKYSIEYGWLQPPVRVLIGIAVAVGLLVACELKAARKYPSLANALDAAAIAILFATFFSAHALWNLIPTSVTFGLLAVVTALAVLLSIRRESLFIAVLGLLGGFSTPVLLSTGENRPIPLFAYLLLLNVGLAWVAYKKSWPVLTFLTLIFTTIYQWGWVFRFLRDASDVSLAMGIFIVFPLVTFAGVLLARRPPLADAESGTDRLFERTALAAAIVPVIFSAYLAGVPAYGARATLLFGFLLLVDVGLLAIAIARRQPFLHTAAGLSTLLVMAVWLAVSYVADARFVTLGFLALFVLLYVSAPAVAARFGRSFDAEGRAAQYVAPLLLFAFAVLAAIEPGFAAPWPLFATLLVLVLVCAWRAAVSGAGFVYYLAAFFAIAAQAVWAVKYLTLETLGTAVTLFAIFGIVSIAVPVVARRMGRALAPEGGAGIVLFASLFLLLYLSSGPVAPAALWALALLLAILNAGLFVESAGAKLPALSIAGSVLSWFILGVWWMQAAGSVGVLSSLAVLIGLTLITLAGHAWASSQSRAIPDVADPALAARGLLTSGLFIGLGGHLFLFFLALNREWALPPWPLFGALAAITLGTSAAALYSRAPLLHAAGVLASAAVVTAWASVAVTPSWPLIALGTAAAVSAYALLFIPVFRNAGDLRIAPAGAAAALFAGEMTVMFATMAGGRPTIAAIMAAHVANISVLLALAWRWQWRHVAVAAVLVSFAGIRGEVAWHEVLALSAAVYAVFVAYPLVLGPRVGSEREPFIAAILASAMFFLIGRDAIEDGNYGSLVGALPVVEALLMAVLVRQLMRIETPGARDLGRLALVAGTALAFVTVAIPLQLDEQWITIGWALEGAALAWLYTRVPHRGLLYAAAALLGAVFVRLALNPEVFYYEPRGQMRILNWYLYAYVIAAASMLLAAWWLSRTDDRLFNTPIKPSQLLPAAAVILLFLLLNIEIADFYSTGPQIAFRFGSGVSQDLTYTIGWLVFGILLLTAGIYFHNRPARVTAVALIAVTAFKCFLYDLREFGGLYRIGSLVGLAIALALVSFALQKYVLAKPKDSQ